MKLSSVGLATICSMVQLKWDEFTGWQSVSSKPYIRNIDVGLLPRTLTCVVSITNVFGSPAIRAYLNAVFFLLRFWHQRSTMAPKWAEDTCGASTCSKRIILSQSLAWAVGHLRCKRHLRCGMIGCLPLGVWGCVDAESCVSRSTNRHAQGAYL